MSDRSRKHGRDHSLDIEDCTTGSESIAKGIKRRRLLPSPLTSCSPGPENPQRIPFLQPPTFKTSRSAPGSLETVQQAHIDLEDNKAFLGRGQPKTSATDTSLDPDPNPSRTETIPDHKPGASRECNSEREDTEGDWSIAYWANTGRWPENFASMSQKQKDSPRKRSHSSSYSQSVRDGDAPRAHTRAFEKVLAANGVYMEELKGRSLVMKASIDFCKQLLQDRHPEPQHPPFPIAQFLPVWQRAQSRNEARVYRDITPLLVPSPELLWICGAQELEYVAEEIGAEWSKCKTLGGPKPRPDLAIGISISAFSEDEIAKLKNHTACERPTLFTDNLYFPFLLCEVKCGDEGINRADRKNMHSSSLAVKAIVELFKTLGDNQAAQLNGQILVFSVSHDNERVKLYGHFPILVTERTTFYRYPIASFDLNFEETHGRKRTHDFVRTIYHKLFPEHVKRIRDVLAKMEDPRNRSMRSDISMEGIESREVIPSAQSSQEPIAFKKPDAPASKKQKGEVALLREQLAEQRKQSDEQKKQSDEQLELMKEQVKALKQLLDR